MSLKFGLFRRSYRNFVSFFFFFFFLYSIFKMLRKKCVDTFFTFSPMLTIFFFFQRRQNYWNFLKYDARQRRIYIFLHVIFVIINHRLRAFIYRIMHCTCVCTAAIRLTVIIEIQNT